MSVSIVDRLGSVTADCDGQVVVLTSDGVAASTTWAEVYEGARGRAAALQARGVAPGDRVAILGFTSLPVIETILGITLAGAAIVMLPLPMRLASREAFIEATQNRVRASDAKLLVLDGFFEAQYEPAVGTGPAVARIDDLLAPEPRFEDVRVEADHLAVLQFTSGSTAEPRAVRLTHRAICNNIWSIADAVEQDKSDLVATWLPLYHDMGLIGTLLTPATTPMSLVTAPAQAFLSRPAMWMEAVSNYGATITCAPNFGYALATRALNRAEDLDLSRLRAALCGAEPVSVETMHAFLDAGARFGLRASSPLPVYGLAEATLAVTFPKVSDEIVVDRVDRELIEHGDYARPVCDDAADVKTIVGLGRPLRGISLRVVDDAGDECPERGVGEIVIASDAVMDGYDKHPEETLRVLRHDWLHTGDLGYTVGGELFVCGRKKDLIIIGGRNIWPEDVEAVAERVPGVRAGNSIAFGVTRSEGKEALILVAETRQDPLSASETASTVASSVRDRIGLPPREVLMLEPGELPKTSSGKLQRNLARQRYLDGTIRALATHGGGI